MSLTALVVVTDADDTLDKVMEWVRANGGYFNPKQELRYEGNLFGIFAAQDIKEDELLINIPWNVVILAESQTKRLENCDTVKLIQQELEKGNESYYAPFVEYLMSAAEKHKSLLPAHWPVEAKSLFQKITPDVIVDPFLQELEWKRECEKYSEVATTAVLTHGEDEGMLPLTDKFNSRGGNWTNVEFLNGEENIAMYVRAMRDIDKGEQLYTDYRDYGQVGTPDMLRDYGFVESYPQRWIFHSHNVAFDVDYDEHDELQVTWKKKYHGKTYNIPDDSVIEFWKQELKRLKEEVYPELILSMPQDDEASCQVRSTGALDIIALYCKDLMTAMALAIEEACDGDVECTGTE